MCEWHANFWLYVLFLSLLSAVKSVNLSYDGFKVSTYVDYLYLYRELEEKRVMRAYL